MNVIAVATLTKSLKLSAGSPTSLHAIRQQQSAVRARILRVPAPLGASLRSSAEEVTKKAIVTDTHFKV